jgi:hypothetical protein
VNVIAKKKKEWKLLSSSSMILQGKVCEPKRSPIANITTKLAHGPSFPGEA